MHRLLFIGVGGTGGKALRFTWKEMDRRLRAKGWTGGEMPEAFQFVHFDLPENFDGYKDPDVPRVVSMDDKMYVNLAESPLEYRTYDQALTMNPTLVGATAGWRPYPPDSIQPPYRGAGQRRAVGRAVGVARLDRVDDAVRQAALRLKSAEAETAIREIRRVFRADGDGQLDGQVFVVGSLAGGSGAGLFLDVIDRVRSHVGDVDWFEHVHLIAVTADAFLTLAAAERPGAEPNSLAALAEYISAFRWEGDLQVHESAILASAGAIHGAGRRTGRHAYLVGNGNNAVNFTKPADVYRCVGKALAAYATTPEIQAFFESVVINFEGAPTVPGMFFADKGDDSAQPIESFGFGSVGLGGDLFGEYAAQRLARAAIERLLARDREEPSLDEHIRRKTGERLSRFFEASGLWEYDAEEDQPRHNQVLDALRDVEDVKTQTRELADDAINAFADIRTALDPETARKSFSQEFDARQTKIEETARQRRSERAQAWTKAVQHRLLEAVVAVASEEGLPVATQLLRELRDQLDDATAQLGQEQNSFMERESHALDEIRALYGEVKDKIVGSSQVHANAATERRKALTFRLEHRVRCDAIDLIREARSGLVTPLIDALRAFENRLQADMADQQGIGSVVEQWPTRAVPQHLRPAPNEQLLTSVDSFPKELDRLVAETVKIDEPRTACSLAVAEIINGGWLSEKDSTRTEVGPQTLIGLDATWNPGLEIIQRPGVPASRASFVVRASTLGMLDRAREWVQDRQGALEQRVNQTLEEYLDPEHAEAAKRAKGFADALANAMNCARPLISVDENVRAAVHMGASTPPSLTMTRIPVGKDHPAREAVEKILLDCGIRPDDLPARFTTDETVRELDVFGFLTESVHPAVLTSAMGPIAKDWTVASTTEAGRRRFWRLRRARSLEMFVPLPPSTQRELVKGWYVAALLAYLRGLEASADREPAPEVWTMTGWQAFPRPLLGDVVRRSADVLPALLESVPLTFLHVAYGQFESTEAYHRLVQLGRPRHAELSHWLGTGERPPGAPEPLLLKDVEPGVDGGGNGDTPITPEAERRRTAVLNALAAPRETYLGVRTMTVDRNVSLPVDRRWEIAPLVLASLDGLIAFVRDADLVAADLEGAATQLGAI